MLLHSFKALGFRDSKKIGLWSDSCTGENKNNIVLSFLSLLVGHDIIAEVDWRFLAVGHTKSNPDLMFGMIQSKMDKSTAVNLEEILVEMNEIAHVSAHIMDISKLRNWHHMTKNFKAVPNIKKRFHFSI